MKTISQVAKRLRPGPVFRVAGAWSAAVAIGAAVLFMSGGGAWADSGAEKSVLVIPALIPKSGVVPYPPENDIRLAYKNRFEPFWTENSYGRFQVNTKTVGYGHMQWSKTPRAGATQGQVGLLGMGGNEGFSEGKRNMPYNDPTDNSVAIVDGFWTPGERFRDNNGDGVYTRADPWTDVIVPQAIDGQDVEGLWEQAGERFVDVDRNGQYTPNGVTITLYDASQDDGSAAVGGSEPPGGVPGDGIFGPATSIASRAAVVTVTVDELQPGFVPNPLPRIAPPDPLWNVAIAAGTYTGSNTLLNFVGDFPMQNFDSDGLAIQPIQPANGYFDPGPGAANVIYQNTGQAVTYQTVQIRWVSANNPADPTLGTWQPVGATTILVMTASIFRTVEPYTDNDKNGVWTNREPFEDYLIRWSWTVAPPTWVMVTEKYIMDNYPGSGVDSLPLDDLLPSRNYPGIPLWYATDGTVGDQTDLYFADADGDGLYTVGEDIWINEAPDVLPIPAGSFTAAVDTRVYDGGNGWRTANNTPGVQSDLYYSGSYAGGTLCIWQDNPAGNAGIYDDGVDTTIWSFAPNGIADNIDRLMDRTGNGVYDGPEKFTDRIDCHMQRTGTILTGSSLQYWDPHGDYAPLSASQNNTRYGVNQAGGNSFNQWWIATFRSRSPGFPGAPPAMQAFNPVPIRPFKLLGAPFVTALGEKNDSGSGPIYSDTTGHYYDSWREYRDLPSSIYHMGGDNRLGEETDPTSFSIFGTDKGTGSPLGFRPDDTITTAGPMAWNIIGDFGYDAGDLLTLEVLTWRTDGTSLTDSAYNAESLLGANNTGLRRDGWVGFDSGDRHCRDSNLDGLLDQGASPDVGFCNYIVDTIAFTPNNGSMTAYPYNRERFSEELMEFTDNIEDFELYSDDGSFIDYLVGIYPDGYPGANFQGLSGFGWGVLTLDRPTMISYGGQFMNMGGDFAMRTVAHEATHDWFGAPDLYDYDTLNGIIVNDPIGSFDLMATAGLVHYTGPLKASFGWTNLTDLKRVLVSGQVENIDLYPIETNPNQYYVYYRDGSAEQFWFWYEAGTGQFAKGFGNGMIIEHVDVGTNGDGYPEQQRHNNHYTWEIVPADGLFQMQDGGNAGDAGDLWPGTSGNTTWTAHTNPSSRWWDLVDSGIEILNIVLPAIPTDPIHVTFRWIDRPVPSLFFVNPPGGTTVGSLYNLTYEAWDFWGGTRIYLYRDNDNSGNDGVRLNSSALTKLPGDTKDLYQTAIGALPDGNYYFYALLVPGTALDEDNNPQTEPAYSTPIPALANVGNGTLTVDSVTITPTASAVTMRQNSSLQVWTVTCTAAAAGATPAKFSVRGSVTQLEAALADADVAFTPAKWFTGITFTVHTGTTLFAVGDTFTFRTTGITPYSALLYVVGGTTPGSNKYPGDQPKFADNDNDRLPDWWEYMIFGNLTTASGVAGAETNHDTDRLNDLYEYWSGTNPLFWDSNADGISDDYDDRDGDGLTNYEEQLLGTRPDMGDTDDDGLGDSNELASGFDPLDGFDPAVARVVNVDGLATSYVEMPIQKRFALDANFTIEAKVKPAADFNQAATVIRRVVGTYYGKLQVNYGIRLSATGLPEAFYTNGAGTEMKAAASTGIPFGVWTSLAATFDGTAKKLSLYINGVLVNSVNTYLLPASLGNAQPFTRAGESFKGSIDELRFWNSTLPAPTILANLARTLIGNEAGLVAYYRFDDGGTTAQDAMLTSAQDWNNDWGNAATLNGNAVFDPPTIEDSDNDGLPDWWEMFYWGDLDEGALDNFDHDLLNNLQEWMSRFGAIPPNPVNDPTNPDSNGDGIVDGWQWIPSIPGPYVGVSPSAGGMVARDGFLQATILIPAVEPTLGVPFSYATYRWTKDADPTVLSNTSSLDLAPLGLGAGVVIHLQVTAQAPSQWTPPPAALIFTSPTATVDVTTSNATALTRPVPLSFLPLSPTPTDTLTVQVRNPNAAAVTLALSWFRNHTFVKTVTKNTAAGATSVFSYPGAGDDPLVAGDIWYFTVYAYDGMGGVSGLYNSLTELGGLGSRLVGNSASGSGGGADDPNAGGITGKITATVTPALPFLDDILLCSATGASAAAGIPFGYFFSWYIFDQTIGGYAPLNQVGPTLDLAVVGNPQTITDGTTIGGVSTGGSYLVLLDRPDEFLITGVTINNPVVDPTTGQITGGTIVTGVNRGGALAGSTTVGGTTVGIGPAGVPITIYNGTTVGGITVNGTITSGTITDGNVFPIPPVGTITLTGATLFRGLDLKGVSHEVLLAGATILSGTTIGGITTGSSVPGLAVGGRLYCQVYAMDAYGKRSETVASNVVTIQPNPSSPTAADGLGAYEPNDTPAQAHRIVPKLNPFDIADPYVQVQATVNGDQDWYWFVVPDTWGNRASRVVFETNDGTTMYNSSHTTGLDKNDTQVHLYDKGLKSLLFVDDVGSRGVPGSTLYGRFDTTLKPGLYYVMVTTLERLAFTYSANLIVEPGAGSLPPTSPTTVTLTPAAPSDSDDLVCTASGATSNLGAGAIVYRYTWFRDGQVMPFGTSESRNWAALSFELAQSTTDNKLNHIFTRPGEGWTCMVFATDANGISTPVASNSVLIAGTIAPPPSAGWEMTITARTTLSGNPVPFSSTVGIGWLAGATNGFDPDMDQQLLVAPPAPGSGLTLPAGTLYGIGLDPLFPALSVDIRPPGAAISWFLKLDLGKLGLSASLTWDNTAVPSGDVPLTLTEIDPTTFMPIPGTTVNMSTSSQLVVTNVPGSAAKIYCVQFGGGAGTQTLKLTTGWNLVSFNVQPAGAAADVETAFIVGGHSVKLGPVWAFENGAYVAATTIETEKGYWVYCPLPAGASVTVFGTPGAGNISLTAGWNLAGFLADMPRPVAPFIDAVYEYNGTAYVTPATVKKGKGYWIHTTAPGTIPAQ